jgi:hypothetical protein
MEEDKIKEAISILENLQLREDAEITGIQIRINVFVPYGTHCIRVEIP